MTVSLKKASLIANEIFETSQYEKVTHTAMDIAHSLCNDTMQHALLHAMERDIAYGIERVIRETKIKYLKKLGQYDHSQDNGATFE